MKNFCLNKNLWKEQRNRKHIFLLVFEFSPFTEISYFLNFPSNVNGRKQHHSANAYSCVHMKFLYQIAGRKYTFFYRVVTKTNDFSLVFRSTFRWRYLTKKMKLSLSYYSKNKTLVNFLLKIVIFFDNILQETRSKN